MVRLMFFIFITIVLTPRCFAVQEVRLATGAEAVVEVPGQKATGVVLMIHGWTGQKDEVGDLFKTLAQELAQQGIISLRFDVIGEAEREKSGYLLTSTFASRVADSQAGLDWIHKHYPDVPIGVLGFSLGGATAMELISQHPDDFLGLALWSAAVNPNEVFVGTNNYQAVREAIEKGKSVMHDWADFTLTKEHVIGMFGYYPMRNLSSFTGHVFAIRGENDFLPSHEQAIFDISNAKTEKAQRLTGADHIFNVLDPETSQKKTVIGLSKTWFVELFSGTLK